MSQFDIGDIDPSTTSGTELANSLLEPWRDALHSQHKGSSRPSYAVTGTYWIDDSATPWKLKLFDGTSDIVVATYDPDNHHVNTVLTDVISESSAGVGVTIDGVLIKDDQLGSSGSRVTKIWTTALDVNGQLVVDAEDAVESSTTDAYESETTTAPPGDGKTIVRDFTSANSTTTPSLDGKTITDRNGSALWANAIDGRHELEYASGTDTYLLLNPQITLTALDVMHFGAAADGVTEDTTAFSDALTAASNSTGKVFVPNGTYLIGSITIPLDVILELSPLAVLKPTSDFSGDLITLDRNAVFEGGKVDCTGQSFSGNVWVFNPTPNITGDSGRLTRAVRNTSADGDSGVGTGQTILLSAMNDGDALYSETLEGVKGDGFENFIRMEADNPGGGQTGYVNSCSFINVWCNGPVRGLSQSLNNGDVDANQFIDFTVQWQADTQRALLIDGRYQKFTNQQIWDAAPADTAIELTATSQLNHVDGYLGDGEISDSGSDNSAVSTRSAFRYVKARKASFTHDFGNISGGGRGFVDATIGIGDGSQGDVCIVQPRSDLNNALLPSWYLLPSTAGVVRFFLFNASGSNIDPGSTTFDVYVFSPRIDL